MDKRVNFWAWHWVAECCTGLSLLPLNEKGKPRRVRGTPGWKTTSSPGTDEGVEGRGEAVLSVGEGREVSSALVGS